MGRTPNGKQRYRCQAYGRQHRENPAPHGYLPERRDESLRAYEERSSLRGLSRTFGVSRTTVTARLKEKAVSVPPLATSLFPAEVTDVLELDELWSFVLRKLNQAWLWLALCRRTRQVVAYAIGDRSMDTCRQLWEAIPQPYRMAHCFHDCDARYLYPVVSRPVQSRAGQHSRLNHYPIFIDKLSLHQYTNRLILFQERIECRHWVTSKQHNGRDRGIAAIV